MTDFMLGHATTMNRVLSIPYNSLPFREFDIYLPTTKASQKPPVICFVHGGAWRSEDKADHAQMACKLAAFTQFPVVVPNYRLTDTSSAGEDHLRHPSHAEDILQFLTFLITWRGPSDDELTQYDPRKLYLIGHSCSAHILSSIFLDSHSVTPSLTPARSVFDAVQAIIISEGIYDLDLLLASFPAYREFFVEDTFGPRTSYSDFSVTTYPLRRSIKARARWFVIHSKGDTLVDTIQSDTMYNHLLRLHRDAGATRTAKTVDHVTYNTTELNEEHNAIPRGEHYVRMVGTFVLGDHAQHNCTGIE